MNAPFVLRLPRGEALRGHSFGIRHSCFVIFSVLCYIFHQSLITGNDGSLFSVHPPIRSLSKEPFNASTSSVGFVIPSSIVIRHSSFSSVRDVHLHNDNAHAAVFCSLDRLPAELQVERFG